MPDELHPQPDRRVGHHRPSPECEVKISAIKNDLKDDIFEIKTTLKELSLSLTKLVLLEERQTQQFAAQERIFKVLERLENRMTELEKQEPFQTYNTGWIDRAILALVTVGASVLMLKLWPTS